MESVGIETPTPVRIKEVDIAFPPYCRSPLKSKTFEIFVRIFSFYDDKSHSNANLRITSENPITDDQCKEPEVMTREVLQDANLLAENAMEFSDIQIQNEALNSSEILHELEHMVDIEENGEQLDPLTEEKYLTIVNELENTVITELDQGAKALMGDKVDNSKDMTSCSEMNLGDNMEHERCQIDTITLVDSSLIPLDDKEETEEEEILDGGASIQLDESFLKDPLALEERNVDGTMIKLQRQQMEIDLLVNRSSIPLDYQDTEEGEILDAASMPYLVETVDPLSNFTEERAKLGEGGGMEEKSNTMRSSKTLKIKEPSCRADGKEVHGSNGSSNFLLNDPIASSPSKELKVAMENPENMSTEGVKVGEKRKRSNTVERKARKKLRERKKRAEKNRQLGVKRFKLQPITKPKPVRYCDHYMHGRCQKGSSCNFSHDTIPLTKSLV